MDQYDVIVVGAGPAGGQCARALSLMGRSVLLLERSKVIGEPNFSSGGTVKETIKDFDLPRSVVQSDWSSISVSSKDDMAEIDYGKVMGHVLDYKLLKQFLAKEAKGNGTELLVGTTATGIKREGKTSVVRFTGGEARAKVVIDASGSASAIAAKTRLIENRGEFAMGFEYLLRTPELKKRNTLQFYLGESMAPRGYLWVFPAFEGTAKVGTCWLGKSGAK